MNDNDEFRFVKELGQELSNGEVSLPSLPDVVLKIKSLLEREECDFEKISQAVRTDPVLVSRVMIFANSAYHNPSGEPVTSLDTAIGRLGFEIIRNAALSLAVKQFFVAEQHKGIAHFIKKVWSRSIMLACMAFAIAKPNRDLNEETAFMCGLLHEIGKLYVLMKSKDYPGFLQNEKSLGHVLETWYSPIGSSIVESWGFSEEITQTLALNDHIDERKNVPPTMVDVILVARLMIDRNEGEDFDWEGTLSCVKLGLDEESLPKYMSAYTEKMQVVRQSLSQAAGA